MYIVYTYTLSNVRDGVSRGNYSVWIPHYYLLTWTHTHTHTHTASSDPPSLSITNPPPTPQMPNGNYNKPRVTPAMVHSALEALQQIEDKQRPLSLTPHETLSTPGTAPIFSEAVASALSAWISQQNSAVSANTTPFVSPPPSTPLEASTELSCRPISASDLIAALSALIPSASLSTSSVSSSSRDTKVAPSLSLRERGGEWKKSFSEGGNEGGEHGNSLKDSNPCSVPATTPQVIVHVCMYQWNQIPLG